MGITVQQALSLDPLINAKLLAGHGGLDREIWLVNVMEVPDIVNWVSPDELILTTGYPFKDSPNDLLSLISKLHDKKVAALAIKTKRFIDDLSQEIIQLADSLNFPLISLPSEARFDKIIQGLLIQIINQDYSVIKKADQIHKTLTNLVLEGGKFQEIAQALSLLCGGEVIIKEVSGRLLAQAKPTKQSGLTTENKNEPIRIYEKQVLIANQAIALIQLSSWCKDIDKEDIMAIDYAANIIAMTMLKSETVKEKEKRYRNDFLNDLVNGKINSCDLAYARGKHFGFNLKLPYVVYLFDFNSPEQNAEKIISTNEILENLEKSISSAYANWGEKCILWSHSGRINVFCPIQPELKDLKNSTLDMAQRVKEIILRDLSQQTVTIGIGTYHNSILNISKSYLEACQAVDTGTRVWGTNGIYHYDDLGVYQLLMHFSDNDKDESYINSCLGKLLVYDKKKNTELVFTLEQLLNYDNLKTTAEKLYIHPKTLALRKSRIEEILNVNLDNPEKRVALSVALKLYRLKNY